MAQDGNGVDLVNEARKRDFKKALSQVPRYNGTTPWRLWKMEFALWLRVYEVIEDEAAKLGATNQHERSSSPENLNNGSRKKLLQV